MSRNLASEPWSFDLVEDDAGDLILTVVCGTVGIFEVSFPLDPAERQGWRESGIAFVRGLAGRVVADPTPYLARSRQPGGTR